MSGPGENLTPALRQLCVNTIKFLAVDQVEAAGSGHPGAPMGMADMAFVLWSSFMRFDPKRPDWPDRDRFVLSAGHASALQYAILHLCGYDLPLEDLRRFRQWRSRAPGHPEYRVTPGVEISTGPLGQGFATAVGMALAGKMAAARYNRAGYQIISYRVFGICGDGDLMEGISYEAASFAGNLGLGNLIFLYDSNGVTIEGSTSLAFGEDVAGRFASMGWHVQRVDGHNHFEIEGALRAAIEERDRPSIIIAKTEIAHGAPTMKGSPRTHGAPLGAEEVRRAKEAASWPVSQPFYVPQAVRDFFNSVVRSGHERRLAWEAEFAEWRKEFPKLAERWDAAYNGVVPQDLYESLLQAAKSSAGKATRTISSKVMQAAHKAVPYLIGGSADLGPSNETILHDAGHIVPTPEGVDFAQPNLHFGIREHAMGAIANGIALCGMFRPYVSTFLVFSDYLKPSVRLASLMEVPTIFIFTHDSFMVGEDGPTHQPVEHLSMLRTIPGVKVFRPADHVEVAAAWTYALKNRHGPVVLALTRQPVPTFERPVNAGLDEVLKGGYVIRLTSNRPDAVIIATGSEVPLTLSAAKLLEGKGIAINVVSMPCMELFLEQSHAWRDFVVPKDTKIITLEAGSTACWYRLCGRDGLAIGLDHFGASAPANVLEREFGFTPEKVSSRIEQWLRGVDAGERIS